MPEDDPREARLVDVPGPSGRALVGAFYANRQEREAAILYLHGKGGNFYSGPGRVIPSHDRTGRFAHLAINMRCHDLGYTDYDTVMPDPKHGHVQVGGGMWERIADGHLDVAAAVAWLRTRGHERIVICGHSSGGYYAAQYGSRPDAAAVGRVLISPVLSHKRHLRNWFESTGGVDTVTAKAHRLVAAGQGHRLLPIDSWYYAISAQSLVERTEEGDDAFTDYLTASSCPTLLIAGSRESRIPAWQTALDSCNGSQHRMAVIEGADHSFTTHPDVLTDMVLSFAASVVAER